MWQTFEQYQAIHGTGGLASIFQYIVYIFPGFTPLLLFVYWLVWVMSIYNVGRMTTGRGNMAVATWAASFATVILSVLLSLVQGLINIETIIIVIIIAGLNTLWLYLSRD